MLNYNDFQYMQDMFYNIWTLYKIPTKLMVF